MVACAEPRTASLRSTTCVVNAIFPPSSEKPCVRNVSPGQTGFRNCAASSFSFVASPPHAFRTTARPRNPNVQSPWRIGPSAKPTRSANAGSACRGFKSPEEAIEKRLLFRRLLLQREIGGAILRRARSVVVTRRARATESAASSVDDRPARLVDRFAVELGARVDDDLCELLQVVRAADAGGGRERQLFARSDAG